jgi:toxin ParE1/3/4
VAAKYRVEITETAQTDLEEIWMRIAADSVDIATRFVLQLEEKTATLEKMPHRCPQIPENEILNADYRHLVLGDYRIIFRIDRRTVWVLRILHGSRLLDLSLFL